MSYPILSGPEDNVLLRGTRALVQKATINASSAGANTIVAGVAAANGAPAKLIRVLSYVLVAAGAVTTTWESSGGTVIGGPMAFPANGGVATPFNPLGHFDSIAGEGLVLFLGGAVQVGGHVTYIVTY
jgi:hypothetical protein